MVYPLGKTHSLEEVARNRSSLKSEQCKQRSYFLSLAYYN